MKSHLLLLLLLLLTGCTTVTTRTVTTDKAGTVTDTVVTTKSADSGALTLATTVATLYAPPRARIVREEKSASDLQRILRGRPITRQEIANRWRPAAP